MAFGQHQKHTSGLLDLAYLFFKPAMQMDKMPEAAMKGGGTLLLFSFSKKEKKKKNINLIGLFIYLFRDSVLQRTKHPIASNDIYSPEEFLFFCHTLSHHILIPVPTTKCTLRIQPHDSDFKRRTDYKYNPRSRSPSFRSLCRRWA